MSDPRQSLVATRGYAMAALLVVMSIMAVVMSMLLPAWRTMAQREREAELVFRGRQIARAVAKYQAARGGFPPSLDILVNEKFLRRKYKDPITGDDFQLVRLGDVQAGQPPGPPQRPPQATQPRQPGQPAASGFVPVTREAAAGGTPVIGVVSRSTAQSLRVIDGKNRYNEMQFTAANVTAQAGVGGRAGQPGVQGAGGAPGRGGRAGAPPPPAGRGLPMPSSGSRPQLPGRR